MSDSMGNIEHWLIVKPDGSVWIDSEPVELGVSGQCVFTGCTVEGDSVHQQLRGAVGTLERVYGLLNNPEGADVLKALAELEAALPDAYGGQS